jgi:hypothetical protein
VTGDTNAVHVQQLAPGVRYRQSYGLPPEIDLGRDGWVANTPTGWIAKWEELA